MTPALGVLLCLAYILGLLATAIPGKVLGIPLVSLGLLLAGTIAAATIPRLWRMGPRSRQWLLAGLVACLASLHFFWRVPYPAATDISRLIPPVSGDQEPIVLVRGKVETSPKVTRSQRGQFLLKVNQLDSVVGGQPANTAKPATGSLYVTVPLLQATGLRPGQAIEVLGSLYQPKPASNPGGFDFRAYLANQGSFAGLRGRQIFTNQAKQSNWGWWAIRQRIVRVQVRWLGSPEGPLVSAMVLGSRVVDLPYDIRDQFSRIGLAHTLAASGFQVSLILGAVLGLTQQLAAKSRFWIGTTSLLVFLGLTGIQPSILRATVMGVGALAAMVMERKAKPLGSLLLSATLLLIFNPLWIWNLGFQLSLLATLGLLVTAAPLTKWLDWLPETIAPLVAVPIAAYLWTLPLQLYAFGVVSPYSIPVNLVTTPLVSVISLGGVLSALAGLMVPSVGSAMAGLLYYPAHWLIQIVQTVNQLPGNVVATGTIAVWQLVTLYGLLAIVWLQTWRRSQATLKRQPLRWNVPAIYLATTALVVGFSLVLLPAWYRYNNLFRVTVLATPGESVLVLQDRGRIGLISNGDDQTINFNVLPFLKKQGINKINWALALTGSGQPLDGWLSILKELSIGTFYHNLPPSSQPQTVLPSVLKTLPQAVAARQGVYQLLNAVDILRLGSMYVQVLNVEPVVLRMQIGDQVWLGVGNLTPETQGILTQAGKLPTAQVFWWAGTSLETQLLNVVQPKVAIASANVVSQETIARLKQQQVQLFWTGRDGAVQWTPNDGFITTVDATDTSNSAL